MNNRKDTIFVTVLVLFSLSLLIFLNSTTSFAFGGGSGPEQYKYGAKSIVCGNKACERASITIKTGEEKNIQLGDKTYKFKAVRVEKTPQKSLIENPDGTTREQTYYSTQIYISIDGSEPMQPHEAKEKAGIEINSYYVNEKGDSMTPELGDSVTIEFQEDRICMAPDCGFRVEKDVYKKWNLVPMYLLGIGDSSLQANEASTCKQEDFLVVYAHDPVKKEYVKLYSYGQTGPVPTPDMQRLQNEKIFALTPFNSVWAYARNECKLVMDMPKQFENLLLLLQQLIDQAENTPMPQHAVQEAKRPPVERAVIPQETPASQEVPVQKAVPVSGKAIESSNNKIGFAPGWNFFMGSKDMEGQPLAEIKGTCEIEKAYNFDASAQSWKKLTKGVGPSEAFLFKVKNKCMLGLTALMAPPSIPVGGG